MKTLKRICFGLLAAMIAILAITTILEEFKGSAFVAKYIYSSVLFVVCWIVLSATGLVYLFKRYLYRNIKIFILHIAFLVILSGAFITWISAKTGSIHLRQNKTCEFYVDKDGKHCQLPFSILLNGFNVVYYPGTQTPQDFVSEIEICGKNHDIFSATVSMNNIVSYKGYRFYQSGYDDDWMGARLSVSHDPYGIAVTYTGYAMLLLSFVLFFFGKQSRFYQLLRHPLLKNTLLFAFLLFGAIGVHAAEKKVHPKVLPQNVAKEFCDMHVYYNGRICPLQTLANDFTLKLYGKTSYKDYSSEQVFTGWLFYYSSWKKQKIIKLKSKGVQNLLEIEGKYASLDDFINNKNSYKLENELNKVFKGEDVDDKKGIKEADEKFNLINMLYAGEMTRIFPYRISGHSINWYATNSHLPLDMDENNWIFIRRSMDYMREMIMKKDYENVVLMVQKLKEYQLKEAAGFLPSNTVFIAEKLYNRIDYIKYLAMLYLLIGILGFVFFIRNMIKMKLHLGWITTLFNILLLLGFLYLLVFIALRGVVSHHFPVSNGYETMLFLAWASLLASLLLQKKIQFVPPFGFLLCGLALMVSIMGRSNPQITHLMPVLSSPLLSIHVVSIMISYVLFAFIMFNGIAGIIIGVSGNNDSCQIERLQIISRIILYPAVFLLATGTFIGAVWANVSWGRYWGWDPKEVWALITLLLYSFPLHSQSLKRFQRPFFFHVFSVAAFFSVLFTYFGVNFLLGGMHSYAG